MNLTREAQAPLVNDLVVPQLNSEFIPRRDVRQFLRDCAYLTKPRLSSLVLLSTAAGFLLGNTGRVDFALLLETLFGTTLVACGASMLNQVLERNTDRLMERTRNRPLAAGRMDAGAVLYCGAALSIVGLMYLALRVNLDSALWAALTLGLYTFIYTPLKKVTTLNTLVGAVPGALPPLIGWAAAQDTGAGLNMHAWSLFMILFVWQLPHFLAIAWIYRADYARAGLQMWPTLDPEGFVTGRQAVMQSLLLLPVSLLPAILRLCNMRYFPGAAALSIVFLTFAVNFAARRTDRAARQLFLASVIYLPLLLAMMLATRI